MNRKGIIYSYTCNAKTLVLDILIQEKTGEYVYKGYRKYFSCTEQNKAIDFCKKYLNSYELFEKPQYKKPY